MQEQGIDKTTIIKGVVVIGGMYVSYRLAKKLIEEIKKRGAENKVDDNPAYQQATVLRSAMNPSGVSWMMSFDTTNRDRVMDTAKAIVNLDEVAKGYRSLYSSSLLDDLQKELSVTDYQKFLTIVSSNPNKVQGKGKEAPVTFTKPSMMIMAKKELFIRSSPDASYHGAIYEAFSEKNILRKAKPGEFLGYATGLQHFDEENNVKFIQVGFTVDAKNAPKEWKDKAKKKVTYWVSASSSYVVQYPSKEVLYKYYPQAGKYLFWMRPLSGESKDKKDEKKDKQVKGIVATGHTTILNEAFQPIGFAKPNMLLGQLEMTLDTDKAKYFQFRTQNNQSRWVHSQNAKLL